MEIFKYLIYCSMGKILETKRRNYSFTFLHVRLKAQNDSILGKYNDKKDFAKRYP